MNRNQPKQGDERMIQEYRSKLKPPLRKPDLRLRDAHLNRRPKLIEGFVAKPATPPPVAAKKPARPPEPVLPPASSPSPQPAKEPPVDRHPLREYFCRWCDTRITARLPPVGWLNLRRHVFRGSLPVPEGLSKQEQNIYRHRLSIGARAILQLGMPRRFPATIG
jgi:hypothetical protein